MVCEAVGLEAFKPCKGSAGVPCLTAWPAGVWCRGIQALAVGDCGSQGGGLGGGLLAEVSTMLLCLGLLCAVLLHLQPVAPPRAIAQHVKCTKMLPFKGDLWFVLLVLCF